MKINPEHFALQFISLSNLPRDIIKLIAEYLPFGSLLNFAATSKDNTRIVSSIFESKQTNYFVDSIVGVWSSNGRFDDQKGLTLLTIGHVNKYEMLVIRQQSESTHTLFKGSEYTGSKKSFTTITDTCKIYDRSPPSRIYSYEVRIHASNKNRSRVERICKYISLNYHSINNCYIEIR